MKVKIVKSTSYDWYKNKVGQIINVHYSHQFDCYNVLDRYIVKPHGLTIACDDCEILEEHRCYTNKIINTSIKNKYANSLMKK